MIRDPYSNFTQHLDICKIFRILFIFTTRAVDLLSAQSNDFIANLEICTHKKSVIPNRVTGRNRTLGVLIFHLSSVRLLFIVPLITIKRLEFKKHREKLIRIESIISGYIWFMCDFSVCLINKKNELISDQKYMSSNGQTIALFN